MRVILHRIVSLTEENPHYFQTIDEQTSSDNSAIAKLAAWASTHTHHSIEEMQIKISKYKREAQERVKKGQLQGPLPNGSPAQQVLKEAKIQDSKLTPKKPSDASITTPVHVNNGDDDDEGQQLEFRKGDIEEDDETNEKQNDETDENPDDTDFKVVPKETTRISIPNSENEGDNKSDSEDDVADENNDEEEDRVFRVGTEVIQLTHKIMKDMKRSVPFLPDTLKTLDGCAHSYSCANCHTVSWVEEETCIGCPNPQMQTFSCSTSQHSVTTTNEAIYCLSLIHI